MTIWVTSDLHFYHLNIIKYSNRPFATVEEMNDKLIENINSVVQPDDELLVLGDWVLYHGRLKDVQKAIDTRLQIKCKNISLVRGNHDPNPGIEPNFDDLFKNRYEYLEFYHHGKLCCFFHYRIHTWRDCHTGSYAFHGHEHRFREWNDKQPGRSCDCGVDAWNYMPQKLDDLIKYLEPRPFGLHEHGTK